MQVSDGRKSYVRKMASSSNYVKNSFSWKSENGRANKNFSD